MIFIVTPVYNRKAFTRNYLIALTKQTVQNFKVIIVDDGSTDGTAEMIEEEFPHVILLKEQGDLWWAEATNIGVKYAFEHNADYIITLNDDTLPSRDFVEKMEYWSEKKPKALLGALAVDVESKKPVFGGEIRNCLTGKSNLLLDKLRIEERSGLHKVNLFPGRGLLIPREVFEIIGLYDSKNFPQTLADLDFTCRAGRSGYEIYCNYDAILGIYQEESGGVSLIKNKNLSNYYKHLFSLKGGGNVIRFTVFAYKNVPKLYFIPFVIQGLLRRSIGYWIK